MSKRCDSCFCEYDSAYSACPYCGFTNGGEALELFHLKPGTVLYGRYSVGKVLGFGGFGIIYKAWDKKENNIKAIKEYYPCQLVTRLPGKSEVKLLSDNTLNEFNNGKKRFLNEAIYLERFKDHPNIVSIIGGFQENNTAYYVMEYLEGMPLNEYISKGFRLSVDEGLKLILSICSAVKALHSAGILHRDISPDNIIIPPDFPESNAKLIDFGAAKFPQEDKDSLETLIMKPGYSPPEQYVTKNKQNEQIDIYALGATLFHILTGEKPEESTNRKIVDNVPAPKELNDQIPGYISDSIQKAMAVDLHLRFKTVDEFINALTGKSKVRTPSHEMKRRKKIRRNSVLTLTAITLLGLITAILSYYREKDSATLPDASINMWYVITGDSETDAIKEETLHVIINDFTNVYPNISISLKGIDKSQYENEVLNVLRHEKTPILLESDCLNSDILDKALDISEVAERESNNCHFLKMYNRYFPQKKQLPVGFNVAAIYVNPEMSSYSKKGVNSLSELLATIPSDISVNGIAINEKYKKYYDETLSGNHTLTDSDSYYSEEAGVYFSSTAEFYKIHRLMIARYKLLYIDTETVPIDFCNFWSILPCEGAERKAAERLLRYLLSEDAQDNLYISNQSSGLPLNKEILDNYKEVYSEFSDFFINIDSYNFS